MMGHITYSIISLICLAIGSAAECDHKSLAPTAKRCFEQDEQMVECLSTQKSTCQCIRKAGSKTRDCLGSCVGDIENALCNADAEKDESQDQDINCDISMAAEAMSRCIDSDATLAACVGSGKVRSCECFQTSDAQECLGGCWNEITAALCSSDFDESKMPLSGQMKDVEGKHSKKSDAAEDQCGLSGQDLMEKTKECVGASKEAIDCFADETKHCMCLKDNPDVALCLGSCWTVVHDVLCRVDEETSKRAKREYAGKSKYRSKKQ